VVQALGHITIEIVRNLGRTGWFLLYSFYMIVRRPPSLVHVLKQLRFIGTKSLFVIVLTAAFTGMVLGLQGYYTLTKFGSEGMLGTVVALSLIRELGPVLAALGRGPVLSVVAMAAIAVLLSVGSTVDAFIALAFVGQFANGALLSFLVYGPMVDIKSTLMFARVFRRRSVVYLVLLPLLLTLVSTAVWNLVAK